METVNVPKRKVGRKLGSCKPPEQHRVKIGFSVAPEVARALEEHVGMGSRSQFIEQLIAEKLGVRRNNF